MSGSTDTGRSPGIKIPAGRTAGRSERLLRLDGSDRRRDVKPGFPIIAPFATSEAALDYLNNEKLTCLLCGRELASLAKHLSDIHAMSVEDYKSRYHLPLTRGLVGTATRKTMGTRMRARVESGEMAQDMVALRKKAMRAPRGASAYKSKVDAQKRDLLQAYNNESRKPRTACKRCGADVPVNNREYCNWECRYHPDQQGPPRVSGWVRNREQRNVEKACEHCGNTFIADRLRDRRFCSRSCAATHHWRAGAYANRA